jgi:Leucine-rich repeat (LRR) protein
MKKVEILYLHNNQFYGSVPVEICELKKLRLLNLSNNLFRGILPENIGKLANLESLLLSGNNLVGPVPVSFGNLQKLRDLTMFKSYPSELCSPKRAFNRFAFNRIYIEGPKNGINSSHYNFKEVYGRERSTNDDESVTIFSGKL